MPTASHKPFIGLMSGTSLDGVDGVIASFSPITLLASSHVPFPTSLRDELMALQQVTHNEIEREALAAHRLVMHYAQCVKRLLETAQLPAQAIGAIGVHGQTIRHCPEKGFTRQINHPALLAELTGIDVIADFRARDIAAGGQGAPLAPAFHRAFFSHPHDTRVIVNIGGIANISVLRAERADHVIGFDTGPGNVLMDCWYQQHQGGGAFDPEGRWAKTGQCHDTLLTALKKDAYFTLPPPKSTGRDLFHAAWLMKQLAPFPQVDPKDVQATLTTFTATTIAQAIAQCAPDVKDVYVCGGGAKNLHLMHTLAQALQEHALKTPLHSTQTLGFAPDHIEALAFAWLAHRFDQRLPGNLPCVTGAKGERVLGALYPAGIIV